MVKVNNKLMLKDQNGFSFIYILLILIIIFLVGAGAYYWGTRNASKESPAPASNSASPSPAVSTIPSPSPSPLPSPSPSPSPIPNPSIKPELLENIKASVVSKNTAALEGYMTDMVDVIIEATECCGNLSKVKAIGEMDYLKDATLPWNFDDNNPIALQLKQKNPQAFPDGIIIGTSANRRLVTFTLNQEKTKIIKVYMAIDYKLFGI